MQFDCGKCVLRVISRAGRPCHFCQLHQYPVTAAHAKVNLMLVSSKS